MGNEEFLKEILESFEFEGDYEKKENHTIGNINDTMILTYNIGDKEKKYVLQKVNKNVFTNPEALMGNVVKITKHINKKVREDNGDINRECLNLVSTKDGKYFYKTDDGNIYRAFHFIDGAKTYMKVENEKHMYETGKALGKFQKQLSDFNAEELFEVIENFHNTPKRYEAFLEAVKNNQANRVESVTQEIEFIITREKELSKLLQLVEEDLIPIRVTHNDTKFNNIMIDNETGKAVCVIDLDTVMPGLSLYDFGDAIRSGCSTATEDETDLSKVTVDLNLYDNFVKGILEECKDTLTRTEIDNIPFSAKLITIELAMRFLTDYLNGDKYFKIDREYHNLERTRNQIKLASEIERKLL